MSKVTGFYSGIKCNGRRYCLHLDYTSLVLELSRNSGNLKITNSSFGVHRIEFGTKIKGNCSKQELIQDWRFQVTDHLLESAQQVASRTSDSKRSIESSSMREFKEELIGTNLSLENLLI